MRAAPDDQRRLLDLQQAETALTQLNHRRGNLSHEAEVIESRARINEIYDRMAVQEASASDLERDINRVEREIEQVRARAAKDRKQQESNQATPKEIESLSRELETLARRQSNLEDQQLELMEQKETALANAKTESVELEVRRAELDTLEEAMAKEIGQIEVEIAAQTKAREQIASEIPEDLMNLYLKIRKNNPTAAAMLRYRRCEGCRIEQSGGELAELRAADDNDVLRCDNCRAILVRTEESGL